MIGPTPPYEWHKVVSSPLEIPYAHKQVLRSVEDSRESGRGLCCRQHVHCTEYSLNNIVINDGFCLSG